MNYAVYGTYMYRTILIVLHLPFPTPTIRLTALRLTHVRDGFGPPDRTQVYSGSQLRERQ